MSASIPILTYHSMNIHGSSAENNDLVGMREDLEVLHKGGYDIVRLRDAVELVVRGGELAHPVVALSCDDGGDFDYKDLPHPTAGMQRSVLNILRDFVRDTGANAHVTSFVITSPTARQALDRTCMIGKGWWNDYWWQSAVDSGLMHIANHSWDHNHDTLPIELGLAIDRGTFKSVDHLQAADFEIRQAAAYLTQKAPNPGLGLFAYPYGEANAYLTEEYFPRYGAELGIVAAFSDRAGYFTTAVERWNISRFMHGRDWRDAAGLRYILDGSL